MFITNKLWITVREPLSMCMWIRKEWGEKWMEHFESGISVMLTKHESSWFWNCIGLNWKWLNDIHRALTLEEQEQQLRRKREQLDLEAELAASTAKYYRPLIWKVLLKDPQMAWIPILKRKKGKWSVNVLSPLAKEYKPGSWKSTQQNNLTKWSLPPDKPLSKDVQPKETKQWF